MSITSQPEQPSPHQPSPHQPLLDLRRREAYFSAHWPGATHLHWPSLPQRLNELPSRPADLQLVGDDPVALRQASELLQAKGYRIHAAFDWARLMTTDTPGLVKNSAESRRLWQPSHSVTEFVQMCEEALTPFDRSNAPSALDVGCGGGRDSVFLAAHGWSVTAVEQQQRVLTRARALEVHWAATLDTPPDPIDWRCDDVTRPVTGFWQKGYDAILAVRFLNRSLWPQMRQALRPGGYLLFETFVQGAEKHGGPKNPNHLLQPGELAQTFAEFRIITDKIAPLADGRPVNRFLAQKPTDPMN
ncbi:methyltransferase domain-containing protein [Hydrogenovibrio halophilus]|uniref:methyltransferase domain-containing protein n=1 Tax=Hydrogenovibrio halophilus TaxID=373391 RepID=UPI0003A8873D|nr:methyltransferase domain-containing protein [Hydrogenovibrio halophilus]